MTAVRKKITNSFGDMKHFIKDFVKDFYSRLKEVSLKEFMAMDFSVLCICIIFAWFCSLREGTGDLYMSIFIPSFFANSLIVLVCCAYKSSKLYTVFTTLLVTTGFALQIFMLPPEEAESLSEVYKYIIFVFVGIVLSAIAVPILAMITSRKDNMKSLRLFILGVSVLVYLILLVFGTEVNGAKSWLIIGGQSLQLTEVTKVLAGIYFATCLVDNKMKVKSKSIKCMAVLLIHAMFLFALNELGTLCMIGIVYFIMNFIFANNRKYVLYELVSLILVFTVLLGICYAFYKTADTGEVTTSETAITQDEAELKNEEKSAVGSVMGRLQSIYPKIAKRVNAFMNSDSLDEVDGYQIKSANKAMLRVEWFGSERGSVASVPEIESDFVFIYLIVRLGFFGALLILICLFSMFAETYIFAARTERTFESILAVCFVSYMVLQSIICICSNIGLFPVVGLPFAFLSNGGSAMCINLVMTFFVIYFMRKESIIPKESEEITGA